ncbi:hypothetical protein [Streptomyces carpinensis]|uniref:Secreted protein n=1 Tax=Streptomyces carpinensis TaxID=66369 RepID=A0ABV1WB43_9ACTN|nr:hypothetical protein [Streptomyces carpinensis]
MANRTMRRAVVAIASTAVAAAGLLATGGSASAATNPSVSHSGGSVSAVRTVGNHHGDRRGAFGHGDAPGSWKRHDDAGRHRIRYVDRDGGRARIDEARRQWVLDQLRRVGDHERSTYGDLERHGRSGC